MNTLEKLINAHSALKVYSIKEGSNIHTELSAYAAGLELLGAELEKMQDEAFYITASNYGLSMAEKLWGRVRDDLSIEKRREMILSRCSFGYEDFTLEGMKKVLKFLGINGQIQEYPKLHRVTVIITDKNLTQGQKNWITSQMQALFPAHLEADAVFADFCWDDIEAKNMTFDSMDSSGMLWSQIDVYTA